MARISVAKTRLTEGLRNAILSAIIQDIPTVDYDQIIQDYLNKRAYEDLPVTLKLHFEAHPDHKEFLGAQYLSSPFGCWVFNKRFTPTREDEDFCFQQRELAGQQRDAIRLARNQVGAWLVNSRTIEDLLETGPQFAKYIPKPEAKIEQLPEVQLAEELTKLGWPKT